MALSEKEKKLTREFIALARKKGYREDGIELLLMLTCTKRMVEEVGSSEEATKRLIEFCKECDTAQECVEKMGELIGI